MPAFQAINGMPYWVELLTSDMQKAREFYSNLLDWEISQYGENYVLARVQGLPVAGIVEIPEISVLQDTWVTYFLVDDIAQRLEEIAAQGGQPLTPVSEVRLGQMAIVVDPAGAILGLVQPAGEDAFVAAGEPGTPVWHELTCQREFDKTLEFYQNVFEWSTQVETEEDGVQYALALIEGGPFAGVLNVSGVADPNLPSFWQSYIGVADVDAAVAQVPALGGDVLEHPQEFSFGRMGLIADPQGAVLVLCEVPPVVEEPEESDPLEGIDLSGLQ